MGRKNRTRLFHFPVVARLAAEAFVFPILDDPPPDACGSRKSGKEAY